VNADNCTKVIFSSKAYIAVVAETFGRVGTETGGIFLGCRISDVWYVIETLDPGPNSIFRSSYFEYDTPYVNHLANKVARFYMRRPELLGLWHRHPGGFDSFSSTDDGTNARYALETGFGAISGLVNLDPHFRLTMYYVSIPQGQEIRNVKYKRLPFEIGDHLIPKDLLALKLAEDFINADRITVTRAKESGGRINLDAKTSAKPNSNQGLLRRIVNKFRPSIRASNGSSTQDAETKPEAEVTSPSPTQTLVLDMLENEMEYLEAQKDYDYAVSMTSQNEITILLKYTQNMAVYPREVECILRISDEGQQYAVIDGNSAAYTQGCVRSYVNGKINTSSGGES